MTTSPAGAPCSIPATELAVAAVGLVACGSLETSPDHAHEAHAIAAQLPIGTKVYVNHLPQRSLGDSMSALLALRAAGLEPVPHLAARRIASRAEARSFLERARAEAGVTKVLLIGGDEMQPRGPYADATALLRDDLLASCGVREIGVAGYPEGHPRIAEAILRSALREKLELAAAQDLGA